MALPFINGVQYHWGQVAIRALGNVFVGVEKISYEEKQSIENNYGAGNYPIGQGQGKIEATCSFTLFQEELEALQAAAPGRRLQAIPNFDITVTFIPEATQALVTHTIRNCRIKNNKRDMSSGDTKVTAEIEVLPSHIDF
jgi:predicted RNase H-like nuclease